MLDTYLPVWYRSLIDCALAFRLEEDLYEKR
jgi:hypothetical protein